MIVAFAEVREGRVVAAAEAFAIGVAIARCNRRTAILPPVVNVRAMAAFKVAAAGLDAIVETPALNIAELLGWRIPASAIMIGGLPVPVPVLGRRAVPGHQQGRCSQCEGKCWQSKFAYLHG